MNNENILNLENETLFKDNKNTKKKNKNKNKIKLDNLFINNILFFLFIFNILFFRLKRMQHNF